MKKILLFFVLLSSFCFAQEKLLWGVASGLNLSKFNGNTEDFTSRTKNKPSFYLGVFAIAPTFEPWVDMKLELLYSKEGSRFVKTGLPQNYYLDYVSMGYLLHIKPYKKLTLNIGFLIDFLVKGDENIPELKNSLFSGKAGIQYSLVDNIGIQASIKTSFSGINETEMITTYPFDSREGTKLQTIQVGIFYLF